MAFASIFVPNFILQAVVRPEPMLRDRAVAIIDGTPPVWNVAAMNDAAEKSGIALGMTKSQAQQFYDIEIRHRSRAQEKAAHAALLDLGWSVSPRIEDTAPDTIVLDIAGLNSLFGSNEQIAAQLAEGALRLGLIAQVATASQVDTAIILSRGFAGITVVAKDKEEQVMGTRPVDVLSPSPEVLETLARWGVHSCAALAALPPFELSERLGQEGIRLHELAHGRTKRSIVLAQRATVFEEEMELEDAVEELEPLSFLLGRLLDQLCARLARRSLAACAIRVRFELEPSFEKDFRRLRETTEKCAPKLYERVLALPVPIRDSKMLLKLLRLHWQSDAPSAPILKITLAADTAKPRITQRGLFLPSSPDPEKLELTVARLANLVGDANVGSPELIDTHRPGEFRMRRFIAPQDAPAKKIRPPKTKHAKEPLNRAPTAAFRVFRPALPAKVDLHDQSPATVRFQGVQGRVIAASGPWRTSGEWWREDGWECDEWDTEIEFAARGHARQRGVYRIFYDSIRGEWFVRGTYD